MKRLVKTITGFVLIGVGLILSIPGIPGPGLAIAFLGLVMLSGQYHWAKRMVDWTKQKFERFRPKSGSSASPDAPC